MKFDDISSAIIKSNDALSRNGRIRNKIEVKKNCRCCDVLGHRIEEEGLEKSYYNSTEIFAIGHYLMVEFLDHRPIP